MTDTKLLEEFIQKSGYKYKYVAQYIGVSYYALRTKMNNKREFKPSEIMKLCELLGISMEEMNKIFFKKVS